MHGRGFEVAALGWLHAWSGFSLSRLFACQLSREGVITEHGLFTQKGEQPIVSERGGMEAKQSKATQRSKPASKRASKVKQRHVDKFV